MSTNLPAVVTQATQPANGLATDLADVTRVDQMVLPIAAALLTCLCAELTEAGAPVCRCCLEFGQLAPADDCACECLGGGQGQAWVRVVQIAPYTSLSGTTPTRSPCSLGAAYTITFELGVRRCVTMTDEYGHVDCDVRTEETARILSDAAAMRRVVACCPALADAQRGSGLWLPTPVMGGCAGGTLSFDTDINPNWAREQIQKRKTAVAGG